MGGAQALQRDNAEDTVGSVAERSRPIDLVHLARYTLGDRALESEILQLFRAQAGIYMDRLKSASDGRSWREAAHTIKGSARGIGAWGVAQAAEAAERLADGPADPAAQATAAILDSGVKQVIGYIDELLAAA